MFNALHQLLVGFVRRTWLVALATIVVCAVFAARAMAAFSIPSLEAPSKRDAVMASPAPRAVPEKVKIDGDVLVERNIFCSSCKRNEDTGPANHSPSYSGLPATLIATSLGKEPRATVRVISTEAQGSWAIGERIPGVGTVARIGG